MFAVQFEDELEVEDGMLLFDEVLCCFSMKHKVK
jgi:hypothetical protein